MPPLLLVKRFPLVLLVTLTALAVPACGDGGAPSNSSEPSRESNTTQRAETAAAGDLGAFCSEARRLKEEGPTVAGEDAQRMLAERFTAMAKVAPSDIRSDVEVIAAMHVDADENDIRPSVSGPSAAESMKPYSELRERHPKVPAAGERFSAFVGDKCGFFF